MHVSMSMHMRMSMCHMGLDMGLSMGHIGLDNGWPWA